MTNAAPRPDDTDDRLDLHNPSVEGAAAAAGHCGMTHLNSGRVCQEPHHHADSCAFVAPSSGASVAAPNPR